MNKDKAQDFRTVRWDGKCPHCAKPIRFSLKTDFGTFGIESPDVEWLSSLDQADREVLAIAQSTGVFVSYDRTARQCKHSPLSNPAKSFLRFLSSMKPQDVPDKAALILLSEFPKSQLAVYSCGDIAAIVVDGQLRMFVPTARLFQRKPQVAAVAGSTLQVKELTRSMQDFREWVKTRMGYVPLEGAMFLKEMRKRCYGAFGTHEKAKGVGGAP